MITRLLSGQISANWTIIKKALYEAHPPGLPMTEEVMANVLETALKDHLQVFVMHESDFEKNTSSIQAIAITAIIIEPVTKVKTLLIYSLYGIEGEEKNWKEGYTYLSKFAKSKGCVNISAYSEVPAVWKMVQGLGGSTNTRYITLEV